MTKTNILKSVLKELNTIDYKRSIDNILNINGLEHKLIVKFAYKCAKDSVKYIDQTEYPDIFDKVNYCLTVLDNYLIDPNSVTVKQLKKAANAASRAADAAANAANAAYWAAKAAYWAAYAAYWAAYATKAANAAYWAAEEVNKESCYKENFNYLVTIITEHYKINNSRLLKALYF